MFIVKNVKTEEQLELAFQIRKKVFVEEQGVPEHLELDEHDKSANHFIVLDSDKVIAAARIREYEPKVGKVERVCVLPEYRGKRIGILIMQAIEKFAIEQGYSKLKLNAQSYAVPFYEKLNYIVSSPEFLDAGIPHRSMEKAI
ncbi:GNAT family N-acetyltransferase [Ureibacillus acetophenoni]|uniref:Predicted GNAT family N-acyltransferase n=1 Tax=Ureibacillus acetophenoni TaxID=614649 RepID=A0A285U053_9BACL|nr:GNAT family N-acetyltransferase [Ureibacillus acetophenoni]SOC35123.1 predicted GNAT family N-acyltransferase [Ureibacillus acetophenoni]